MSERAISAPLTGDEIISIAVDEFRKRLKTLSPLQGGKEYSGFEISFEHRIKLFTMAGGGAGEKSTLAWGGASAGEGIEAESVEKKAEYKSDPDVNAERISHDLPLNVEVDNGKRGKTMKKVRVKE